MEYGRRLAALKERVNDRICLVICLFRKAAYLARLEGPDNGSGSRRL